MWLAVGGEIRPSFNRKPEAHVSEAELPEFPGNAGASGFGLNDGIAVADAGFISPPFLS